jgi:hypothetical protein
MLPSKFTQYIAVAATFKLSVFWISKRGIDNILYQSFKLLKCHSPIAHDHDTPLEATSFYKYSTLP